MMTTSTANDSQIAGILADDGLHRPRRSAALAAQKNWQKLELIDDIPTEDDIYIIEDKRPQQVIQISGARNGLKPKPSVAKKSTTPAAMVSSTAAIDLPPVKIPRMRYGRQDVDTDYIPQLSEQVVTRGQQIMVNRFVLNPLTFTSAVNNTIRAVRISPQTAPKQSPATVGQLRALRGQNVVTIESGDKLRVIVRTQAGQSTKKPTVRKLHPNEPFILPNVVDEDIQEIVGTYEVNEEDIVITKNDDKTDSLHLEVFSDKDLEELVAKKRLTEDIEVVDEVKATEPPKSPVKPMTKTFTLLSKSKPLDGHLEPVIGGLEMECENFDDEFTDGVFCDCEDDVLSLNQWNQSVTLKRDYEGYKKCVLSTKDVKYLRESEVTEPVGVMTVVVSETSKVITSTPKPTPPAVARPRYRPPAQTSQSILRPISTPRQPNAITYQRGQRMPAPTSTYQLANQTPIQNTIQSPFQFLPGTTSPLILAPIGSNMMRQAILPTGIPIIISSTGAVVPNAVVMSANQQNYITTNATQNLQFYGQQPQPIFTTTQPVYRTQYRGTYPRGATQTAVRAPLPRPPIGRPSNYRPTGPVVTPPTGYRAPNTGFRTPAPRMSYNTPVAGSPSVARPIPINLKTLLDCMSTLTTTPTKKINMRTVLSIKPLPFTWPSNIDDLISSLIKLDNALMKEKFKESPIAWMVTSQLIVPPKCQTCQKGICNQVNKTQNTKYEYWNCNNSRCNASFVIDRPHIFTGPKFDIPASKLLFIVYYWSIQVDVEDLIKTGQIEMSTEKIYNVWQRLQSVCAFALKTKDSKIGSKTREVEIASVRVADFVVLGAMEYQSHRVKLAVVPVSLMNERNGKALILNPFVLWIETGTTLKTCESKFESLRDYGFNVKMVSKNQIIGQTNNANKNPTTIGAYLMYHLQRFFKDFALTGLTTEILSNILDELLWRERYGTNPFTAFYNIVKHISEQCGLRQSSVMTPIVVRNPTPPAPASRPRVLAPVLNEKNSIFVDEYYYSSLELTKEATKKSVPEAEVAKETIQCHMCQMFFNNILIVKHLLDHLEKERGGRVRKGDNNEIECKHCLRYFNNRTLHMHEELTAMKVIPYSCRICIVPFYARHPFIQHMKTCHYAGEMPYYCDICSYRSSFQKNLLDHFEHSHSDTSQLMCPFCVRVYEISKFKNLSQFFYRHLQSHYAVASVYDCEKCVLTFVSKPDLKDHCFKGHNPAAPMDEKFEIKTYVVEEENKQLCVRAKEDELFTPFLPSFTDTSLAPNAQPNTEQPTDGNAMSFEMSCEPDISEFLAIEPECHISLNEDNMPFENFIVPVDCDYTEQQLTQILSNSFQLKPNSEDVEEGVKTEVLFDNKTIVCYECKSNLIVSHYKSKSVCEKCNFTTHCTTAFAEHTASAHFKPELINECTVLRPYPQLVTYDIHCGYSDCSFTANEGNQMAIHMIKENHMICICKLLAQTTTTTPDCLSIKTEKPEPMDTSEGPNVSNDTSEAPEPSNDTFEAPEPSNDTSEAPEPSNDTSEAPDHSNSTSEAPDTSNDASEAPEPTINTTEAPDPSNDVSQ